MEKKIKSYLYDVAVKQNISTLAGKRHYAHYFDKGKHALSTEPFQILQRPTQQSCASRFLTEGNPDVICIYSVKLRSSNAECLPLCLFQHSRWRNVWNHMVFCYTMRTRLSLYRSIHGRGGCCACWLCRRGSPKCTTSSKMHIKMSVWNLGFQIKLEKGFCSIDQPQEYFQPQPTEHFTQKCSSSSEDRSGIFEIPKAEGNIHWVYVWLEMPYKHVFNYFFLKFHD